MKYKFPAGYFRYNSFLSSDSCVINDMSDGFLNLTGYSKNEIIDKSIDYVFGNLLRIPLKKLRKVNSKGIVECYLFTRALHPREVFIKLVKDRNTGNSVYFFVEKPNSELDDRLILMGQLIHNNAAGYALFATPDLLLLKANQQYLDFLDAPYNRADYSMGKSIREIMTDYRGSQTEAIWNTVIGTGKINHIKEGKHVTGSSSTYWDSNITPVFEHGKMKYIYETSTNVTERVLNRQLIKDQADHLAKALQLKAEILESISDGFFSLDRDWRFTYVNHCAAYNVGFKPEDLLNQNIWDKFITIKDSVLETNFRRVMLERESVNFEFSGILTDCYYNCSVYPTVDGIAVYWVDITKHKLAEKEIVRNKMKADILYEVAEKLHASDKPQEIVEELCLKVMKFLDCHIFFNYLVNNKVQKLQLNAFAGLEDKAKKDLEWLDYGVSICGCAARDGLRIVADHIQISSDIRTELIKSIGIKVYACHPLIEKDKVIGTLAFGSRSRDAFLDDELALMKAVADQVGVAMNRIRTEHIVKEQHQLMLKAEKERNSALKRAIEMKDEFLSLISHEFKTPLAVINSAIQAMEHICKDELSDKSKSFLNKIRQNSFRQLRLVNNLLDITRVNSGHIKLNVKNVDIEFITKSITESVQLYAQQKNIKLTFVSSIGERMIGMDEEKYERILLNLLSNAIKFTPKGKLITVKASLKTIRSKQKVCIEVKDQGMGIPEEKKGIIFERFGQVDSSLSRQAEGAGIGLHLVRKLVKSLSGTISVDSQVDFGSTFTLLFPDIRIEESPLEEMRFEIDDNRLIRATEVEFSDIYL